MPVPSLLSSHAPTFRVSLLRIWGDKAPAISGYQIVSAANRIVENITSMSVVESRTQEMQRTSALHTSQSMGIFLKTRVGDVTTMASGIRSTSSPTPGTQPKLLSVLRTPGRRRHRIHPGLGMEGKDPTSDRSERTNAVSLCARYLVTVQVRMEGGVW